jgi:ABC-2 type transport system ATP-binding protein
VSAGLQAHPVRASSVVASGAYRPTTPSVSAITCSDLWKSFGDVAALKGLHLDVRLGRVTGFLGPNGAGKTTTLRILAGLSAPDRGEVNTLGGDPRRDTHLRRRIGYLPGELHLDEQLSVEDTLSWWARLRGGVDAGYVHELCERLALDPTRDTRGLSSGNRRKVGLVGALMARPELLLLDEPTSGLDPIVQAEFAELVQEVRSEGRTVLLSSHVLSEVQHLADEVTLVRAGEIVLSGSMEDLRQRAQQPFVAWFRDDPPIDELQGVAGVSGVDRRGARVSGRVAGSPSALLAVLARHPVDHLVLPEPDLEDLFLQYYEDQP